MTILAGKLTSSPSANAAKLDWTRSRNSARSSRGISSSKREKHPWLHAAGFEERVRNGTEEPNPSWMPALVGRRDPLLGPQREDRVQEIVPFETVLCVDWHRL